MQSQNNNRIIDVDHVWMRYDRKTILRDISLSVNEGDFIAITGPNGGGKTTLLRLILKLLTPSKGQVTYLRNGVETKSIAIGYLPQKNMIDSRFPITVREVIRSGLLASPIVREEKERMVNETMNLVGLLEHADSSIGELSGGQMQRALLGRAIISNPDVLVLDEPLSYVDKRFEHHLYSMIEEISRHSTILLVSHEMSIIAGMATRHMIIDHTLHECNAAHHGIISTCDDSE